MAISEASAASSSGVFNDYPHDRRIIIYPIYINAKAKIVEGRRIGVKYCVDQPTLQEILDVLEHLGFEAEVEVHIGSFLRVPGSCHAAAMHLKHSRCADAG
mmetsp:Transcript_24422/g.53270  ORF Transcript_24422/g.53270 Transcript_24422/m.53270 type:complete len:101 (+) Transcript_24422:274-576(+)